MGKLTVVAEKNSARLDLVLLGDLDNGSGVEEGPTSAAKGAVRHDVNPFGLAELDNLILR